jgi:hypothetical protein
MRQFSGEFMSLANLLVGSPCISRTAGVAVIFAQLLRSPVLIIVCTACRELVSACQVIGCWHALSKALTAVCCHSVSLAVRFVSDDNLILPRSQQAKTTSSSSNGSSNGSIGGNDQPQGQEGSANGSGQPGKGFGCQAGMHVPRGSILCICPIESHHDPRLYPDEPWAFKPDR